MASHGNESPMTDDEGVAVSGEEVKGSIEQALVREQLLVVLRCMLNRVRLRIRRSPLKSTKKSPQQLRQSRPSLSQPPKLRRTIHEKNPIPGPSWRMPRIQKRIHLSPHPRPPVHRVSQKGPL